MRPPGWMEMTYVGKSADGRSIDYSLRVRKWHPGFWLFVLRTLLGRQP